MTPVSIMQDVWDSLRLHLNKKDPTRKNGVTANSPTGGWLTEGYLNLVYPD